MPERHSLSSQSLKVFAAILVKAGSANGRDHPEAHVPPGGWPGFAGMARPCWHKGKRELITAGLIRQDGSGRRAVLIVLEGGLMPEGDGMVPAAVSRVHLALLRLSPVDIRVYFALTLAADQHKGESFASMDTVAAWASLPRRTFFDGLKRLKAAELYQRIRKGLWRINPGGLEGSQFGFVRRDTLARFGISMDNENCKQNRTGTVSRAALNCKQSRTETVSGAAPVPEPDHNPDQEPVISAPAGAPTPLIPAGWIRAVDPERREYTRTEALPLSHAGRAPRTSTTISGGQDGATEANTQGVSND